MLQTMREENEQTVTQTLDQKLGSSSLTRKSTTPSKGSKTPKLPSQSSSPIVSQSPRNVLAADGHYVADTNISTKQLTARSDHSETIVTQSNSSSINQVGSTALVQPVSNQIGATVSEMIDTCSGSENRASASNRHSITPGDVNMCNLSQESGVMNLDVFGLSGESRQDVICESNSNCFSSSNNAERVKSNRETPYSEMEVNSNSFSHVRKISFDDIEEEPLQGSVEQNIAKSVVDQGKSAKMDILSKSAGHLSLKMLLERKDENQSGLNKSTGLLEKSKHNFLMNQSNVQGRSAFVPFAQVQQPRRDSGEASQSLPLNIPTTAPSITEKSVSIGNESTVQSGAQSTNITVIPLPSKETVHISNVHQPAQITQDNILKLFPSTATVQFSSHLGDKVPLAYTLSSSLTASCSTNSSVIDSLTILTPSTSVTSSSAHVTLSSSQISPGTSKHLRSRFTPIRPKGSPNKGASIRETKADNPVYDKRPVSEILKEKRAKEQAEALAKLQAGITMPTIPFQSSIPLNSGNFGNLQHLQAVSGKEVVIIVNNQASGKLQNLANQTTVVTQPIPDTRQDKDLGKDSTRASKHGETVSAQKSSEEGKSLGQMKNNDTNVRLHVKGNDGITESDNLETENSISHFRDLQPASSSSEMETESDDLSIISESHVPERGNNSTLIGVEQEQLEQFEQIYTETPAKIAKLNITSPFRPDSACSLGRETPLRITKPQEPSTSRPESACSFGRETPSGARKRKSSDYQHRKDFKRLNSTGDEGEELVTDRNVTELLSPGSEGPVSDSHRRTQSCTFELDRDVKRSINFSGKPQTPNLSEGLQSPDISSLEEEALIESFPNSLFVMRPHKSQRHSIGVNARSVKVSQQKLLKQKQALDKQVGSFLEQNQSITYGVNQTRSSSHDESKVNPDFKVPFSSQAVVKDSGKDVTKNISIVSDVQDPFATTGHITGISSAQNSRFETEPSGLPSDVADWINETIEKRQTLNQSVLSEPELGVLNPQRASTAIDFVAPKFHFEVDSDVRAKSSLSACNSDSRMSQKRPGSKGLNDGNFTVPKAPSLTLKIKDLPSRTGEAQNPSQRCQSLPMFTSTSKSPVSPICLPENKHPLYQRAVSMSPRQAGEGQMGQSTLLSPVSGLTSPLRRIEVRDNHPISISVHSAISVTSVTSLMSRDESGKKFTNFGNVAKLNQGQLDEGRGHVGSYLASIQHNLQKPKDSMHDFDQIKSKDVFVKPSTKLTIGSRPQTFPNLKNTPPANPVIVSDNSTSLAQFSDSGYHSSGTSPVLNSTPVSGTQGREIVPFGQTSNDRVSESPISMSPSIHQSPHVTPKIKVTLSQSDDSLQSVSKLAQSSISSSQTSAFIPIQSSNQNMRFVTPTPIRPTVSLPNQYQVSAAVENFINQPRHLMVSNQLDVDEDQDVHMISPKAHDPPPYETAVKSLRQSNLNIACGKSSLDVSGVKTGTQNDKDERWYQNDGTFHNDSGVFTTERVSLLANMGKDVSSIDKESFGPFASKLVQLSKQTKSSPSQQDLIPVKGTNLSSSNQPFVTLAGHLTYDLAMPSSNSGVSSDDAIAMQSNINERLGSENKGRYVEMTTDGMDSSDDGITGIDLSMTQSTTKFSTDRQTSLFIPSRGGSNTDQKGARGVLSQTNEHDVSVFNINMNHFRQQKSQSLRHLSSNSTQNDQVLYSTTPSFPNLLSNNQPTYKNISNSHISSFMDSEKPASVTSVIPLSSNFALNADNPAIKDFVSSDDALQAQGYVEMSPSESTQAILDNDLTELGETQNNDSVINQRNDRIELSEDFDLMLQEWNNLL